MAITKLVQQFGPGASGKSSVVKNPMAICMLVRYARKVIDEDPKSVSFIARLAKLTTSVQRQMHEFLEGLLRHKSDMVNIEAARAICDMKSITASDLVRPVAGESPLSG